MHVGRMNALLRRAFERSGKTRAQVATDCGVSTVSVTCWLNGTRTPSTKSLPLFVESCGLTMAEFYETDAAIPIAARDTLPLDYVPSIADAPPPGDEDESGFVVVTDAERKAGEAA